MARLTDEEKAVLKRLKDKQEAPDEGPISRAINVTVDLGDKVQVAMAKKMGFLPSDDDDNDDDDDKDDDDKDKETPPKRRGYFND